MTAELGERETSTWTCLQKCNDHPFLEETQTREPIARMSEVRMNSTDQDEFEASAMKYVERYMDAAQHLPNDIQRVLSEIRELDALTCMELREYEQRHQAYMDDIKSGDSTARRKSHSILRRSLLQEREYGDERLQLAGQLIELIEVSAKHLEEQLQALEATQYETELIGGNYRVADDVSQTAIRLDSRPATKMACKRQGKPTAKRREDEMLKLEKKTLTGSDKRTLKGRRKPSGKTQLVKPVPSPPVEQAVLAVDPDEPVYCVCQRISFGEMIGCDNDDCQIEWFHFECVGLTSKPKGKWYCPRCRKEHNRGDKTKVAKTST